MDRIKNIFGIATRGATTTLRQLVDRVRKGAAKAKKAWEDESLKDLMSALTEITTSGLLVVGSLPLAGLYAIFDSVGLIAVGLKNKSADAAIAGTVAVIGGYGLQVATSTVLAMHPALVAVSGIASLSLVIGLVMNLTLSISRAVSRKVDSVQESYKAHKEETRIREVATQQAAA